MKTMILAAVALLGASSANAATVAFDFDTLISGNLVGAYNGATFTDFIVQIGFGPTSPPNFSYNLADGAGFDYASGFTAFSFTSGVFSTSTVSVYSGLGGLGTLLGSTVINDPPASPGAFAPFSVSFAGTGKSVIVTGVAGQFGWDDLQLEVAGGAVPEPQSWAMLIAGFGLVGATMRRRRTAIAA